MNVNLERLKMKSYMKSTVDLYLAERRGLFHYNFIKLILRMAIILYTVIILVLSVLYTYSVLSPYHPSHYQEAKCFTKSWRRSGTSRDRQIIAQVLYTEDFETYYNGTAYICGYHPNDPSLSTCERNKARSSNSYECLYSINTLLTSTGSHESGLLFTSDTLDRASEMHAYATMPAIIVTSVTLGLHIVVVIILIKSHESFDMKQPWKYWLPHKTHRVLFVKNHRNERTQKEKSDIEDKKYPTYELDFSPDCSFENSKESERSKFVTSNVPFLELMKWKAKCQKEVIVLMDMPQFIFITRKNFFLHLVPLACIPSFVISYVLGGIQMLSVGISITTTIFLVYYYLVSTIINPYTPGYMVTDWRVIKFERFLDYTAIQYVWYYEFDSVTYGSKKDFLRLIEGNDYMEIFPFEAIDKLKEFIDKRIRETKEEIANKNTKSTRFGTTPNNPLPTDIGINNTNNCNHNYKSSHSHLPPGQSHLSPSPPVPPPPVELPYAQTYISEQSNNYYHPYVTNYNDPTTHGNYYENQGGSSSIMHNATDNYSNANMETAQYYSADPVISPEYMSNYYNYSDHQQNQHKE